MTKSNAEVKIELPQSERPVLKYIVKDCCKRFGNKEKAAIAKLYNKNGIEMSKDDAQFFKNGDCFYLAFEGE